MNHTLNLAPAPFEMIRSGKKTIELRLWDEKRQKIQPGDTLTFVKGEESLAARVVKLHLFPDFAELYRHLPLLQCGYTPEDVHTAAPADMNLYYPLEKQAQYGVVGIEIQLL